MKYNKFLITLMLCIATQPTISLCFDNQKANAAEFSESGNTSDEPTPSWWRPYTPQFMQDLADRVNAWSTKKKFAVAGAILTGLAALYNKDAVMAWVQSLLQAPTEKNFFLSVEEKRELGIPITYHFPREDLHDKTKIKRLQDMNRPMQAFFKKASTPLPNSVDENKAQEEAAKLIKWHRPGHSWERTSISYRIPDSGGRTAEEREKLDQPISINERARLLYLQGIGENPEAFIY